MASDLLSALDWVVENAATYNIRVVNMSLGMGPEQEAALDPLVQAVETVWDAGIVVVCSAGNYGRDGNFTITVPGTSPKVITVGSLTDWKSMDANDPLATFSPDGRWIAYTSDVTGRKEVYVEPFPGPGSPRQVSAEGGTAARWRADGREIFFVAPTEEIMSVAVDRYNGVGHLERIQNTIQIPDKRTLLTLGDTAGPAYAAFHEEVGCELWCDEEAHTLTIRGDDPLGRAWRSTACTRRS